MVSLAPGLVCSWRWNGRDFAHPMCSAGSSSGACTRDRAVVPSLACCYTFRSSPLSESCTEWTCSAGGILGVHASARQQTKRVSEGCNARRIGFSQVSCRCTRRGFRPSSSYILWRKGRVKPSSPALAALSDSNPRDAKVHREEFGRNSESEEEARTRNWKENGWAPWEELRTPEAQFAVDTVQEAGADEPVIPMETYKKLDHKYYYEDLRKRMEENQKQADEDRLKFLNSERSYWDTEPRVFRLTPPRDWPPPNWKVDAEELAYIREAHTPEAVELDPSNVVKSITHPDDIKSRTPRWNMFLKQYNEWKAANKHIMEQEALEVDEEYYPGRRKTGKEYNENMHELPYVYPGQHYFGRVTYLSLYEGAFVDFGCVHDGWIPIMDNDWYEIRKYIRLGMPVHVEVLAKRDPYRFRFPIQMRFVEPNIDHLIFRRFKHPPIFGRVQDENLDEVAREANRPFFPKLRPEVNPEDEEELIPVHPFISRLWMVHEAERIELAKEDGDDEEWDEWEFPEENDPTGEWTYEPGLVHQSIEGMDIPMIILPVEDQYLDLKAARVEKEAFKKLAAEALAKGEEFVEPEGRFQKRVMELNNMHRQRIHEQKEALLRDRTIRLELGLPLEEPGRYADKSFWGKNPYDPREPQWRHDYWGDPANPDEDIRKDKQAKSKTEKDFEEEEDDESSEMIFIDDTLSTEDEGVVVETERKFVAQRVPSEADLRFIFGDSDETETSNGRPVRTINLFKDTYLMEKGILNDLEDFQEDVEGADDTNDLQ